VKTVRSPIAVYLVLIIILTSATWIIKRTTEVKGETVAGVSMSLPDQIGEWVGRPTEVFQVERDVLGIDTEFSRKIYRRSDGREIFLGIVLSGRDRTSIHPPEACLVGQGWRISSGQTIRIPMTNPKPYSLDLMRLTASKDFSDRNQQTVQYRQWYLYWFVGQSRLTPNHFKRVVWTAVDRIFSGIQHRWAYIAVSVNVPIGRETETQTMVDDFLKKAVPTFQKISG
jgi:EpsI family protein